MRLIEKQFDFIRQPTVRLVGDRVQTHVFGFRLDDTVKGGGLDLLLELSGSVEGPAMFVAHMSAKVSRKMYGRRVGIPYKHLNSKKLPIHNIRHREGPFL